MPECILYMKPPTIIYSFNNPFPYKLGFKYSKLTALDLRSDKEQAKLTENQKHYLADLHIDSEIINLSFDNRVMKSLYDKDSLTIKHFVFIAIVVFIMILVVLQISGKVDVMGMLTGSMR